eukprot:1081-Amphidinium_carterae.1
MPRTRQCRVFVALMAVALVSESISGACLSSSTQSKPCRPKCLGGAWVLIREKGSQSMQSAAITKELIGS